MSLKLAVVLGLVLLVVIGFAFHWWILDVRRIWDWLVYAEPEEGVMPHAGNHGRVAAEAHMNLPGPDRTPAPWAGEHHPTADEWEQLDPDQAADLLIAEWHEDLPTYGVLKWTPESWLDRFGDMRGFPWNEPNSDLGNDWRDDPDLIVWDAKRQAARCWEILHVEFPRLRAELCGAAA